jgi:fatty acid desaturase
MGKTNEPLAEVRKTLRIPWYRCPIAPARLRELTQRSDLKGFGQALGHLFLIAGTGALAYIFFERRVWIAFAFSLFAFGTVYAFANPACHELSHGTVFKTKWLNSLFLRVFALMAWFNPDRYKMSHTYHHLYTLHPRGDREVELPKYPSLEFWYMLQLFTFNLFGGYESNGLIPKTRSMVQLAILRRLDTEWSEAIYAGQGEALAKAVNWARFHLLFHLSVIVVSIVLKLWMVPVLVTFGAFMANWYRYLTAVPQHCGLRDDVPDFRLCARTITLDPLSRLLYWNMNWHLEHHMFAAVPCYNLKKLHEVLASDMPKPRTLLGAWREMRAIWKRQQIEPGYQFNTPLPQRGGSAPEAREALEASLGELAPRLLVEESPGAKNSG